MYDMYPWDRRAMPARGPYEGADPATRAVQVALDRRDNGGDAAAPPAAVPPAAAPPAAAPPAVGTAASAAPRPTRQ